jgi:hypothetical protein
VATTPAGVADRIDLRAPAAPPTGSGAPSGSGALGVALPKDHSDGYALLDGHSSAVGIQVIPEPRVACRYCRRPG